MARDSETRSDALPAKRDEVAAQLRHLADLVEHDRWEDAGRCMDVVKDGFMSVFAAWNKLRFRRAVERVSYTASGEQLEVNRQPALVLSAEAWADIVADAGTHSYGFTADVRRHAP